LETFAGRTAVITGGGSGFGREFAMLAHKAGMNVVIADVQQDALERVRAELEALGAPVLAVRTDVASSTAVQALADATVTRFGAPSLVFNNAGVGGTGGLLWENSQADWEWALGVNLWGVIHGVQAFVPWMLRQGTDCAIVNTGSKQGITCPPGDTAYNVSKAGIKVVSEALAHELRNIAGSRITAHLLVPGFTFTGFTRVRTNTKPDGAWMPAQVIDFMLERMAAGDFYILCPDNDVTRELDNLRIAWAAADITENRPPLSRWHPDYKDEFAAYLAAALVAR